MHLRLFRGARGLSDAQLARFTQIDHAGEMAFVLTRPAPNGCGTLGLARAVADPDNIVGEFAIVVRSDLQGQGLVDTAAGRTLVRALRQLGAEAR